MAAGIKKKRVMKAKKTQLIVKSLHTIKHNLDKKKDQGQETAGDTMDMS